VILFGFVEFVVAPLAGGFGSWLEGGFGSVLASGSIVIQMKRNDAQKPMIE
jgi:hypothetical protein